MASSDREEGLGCRGREEGKARSHEQRASVRNTDPGGILTAHACVCLCVCVACVCVCVCA